MNQQIYGYLLSILSLVFTATVGVIGKELVRYLRSHQKMKWASAAVMFVEETYKDLDGQAKFAKAVDWFVNQLNHVGIKNVSNEEVEGLIQASVKEMRQVFNKEYADPANDVAPEPVKEVVQEVVQEVEKPVSEMTSTDIKNIVTQVVQEHVQATPPVTTTPVQA